MFSRNYHQTSGPRNYNNHRSKEYYTSVEIFTAKEVEDRVKLMEDINIWLDEVNPRIVMQQTVTSPVDNSLSFVFFFYQVEDRRDRR